MEGEGCLRLRHKCAFNAGRKGRKNEKDPEPHLPPSPASMMMAPICNFKKNIFRPLPNSFFVGGFLWAFLVGTATKKRG